MRIKTAGRIYQKAERTEFATKDKCKRIFEKLIASQLTVRNE